MSLLETILALSLFSFFLLTVFVLFNKGIGAFGFLQARQSIQGEMQRVKSLFESDFRLTHLRSIGVESSTVNIAEETFRRDDICCLTVDDWRENLNIEPDTGLPLWNRYIVYQSSLDESGTLRRLLVDPELPTPLRVRPLTGLDSIESDRVLGRTLVTENLESFECDLSLARQEVALKVVLRKRGGSRGLDAKRTDEVVEASFHWRPINTVPKL